MLSDAHRREFETFGFLRLRGLLADVIERIDADVDHVLGRDLLHVLVCEQFMAGAPDGDHRVRVARLGPADDDGPLRYLRDHPGLRSITATLLGADVAHYLSSLASVYRCDVHWHHDGLFKRADGRHVQVMIYLDALDATNGALRVLPGSHIAGPYRDAIDRELLHHGRPTAQAFAGSSADLPAVVLDVVPGDVIVLDLDTVHASFHGADRRLLTMNFGPPTPGPAPTFDVETLHLRELAIGTLAVPV